MTDMLGERKSGWVETVQELVYNAFRAPIGGYCVRQDSWAIAEVQ